jgi:hypothetical protein
VQSRKTLFTILQRRAKILREGERWGGERERDGRMGSTEKMTNNAGDDGSTLLEPKAKTGGKRYIIQQYVDFNVPIGFINLISISLQRYKLYSQKQVFMFTIY